MSRSIRSILGLSLILGIVIVAWCLQSRLLINWDVSWDLLATKRLLAGGTYTKDFFDLNPPLIFFEYAPVVFFESLFSINEPSALRLYIFLLAFISLSLCSFLIRHITTKKEKGLAYSLIVMITLIFLVLPMNDFGEREHMLLIFTLPYFLMVIYRLQNKTIPPLFAIGIGLFAVLGFALKPYFLIPLIFIECYYCYLTRKVFSLFRFEVISILIFLMIYIASIFIFYPDYIFTVIPLSHSFYYDGFSDSWILILTNISIIFCYFSMIVYLMQYKNKNYVLLKSVLVVAMIGFLMSYFAQRTDWNYHAFPAYSMALLLSVIVLGIGIQQGNKIFFTALYGAGIWLFFVSYTNGLYASGIIYKNNTESLIAFLKEHAAQKSVYYIAASPREIFPAVNYANTQYASRFLHVFWAPALRKQSEKKNNDYKNEENFLTNKLIEDISTQKPEFIFVDVKEMKTFFGLRRFDYLSYLLKNKTFQTAWKPYRYITTIEKNYSTLNEKKWRLYVFQTIKDIKLSSLPGRAIILTGMGKTRIAYPIINKKFVYRENKPVYLTLDFTAEELHFLAGQAGFIRRNKENSNLLDQILTKSIYFPVYQFQVWQRRENANSERLG